MSKIRFAVVGCGNIGSRHLSILDSESRASIAGICDIDQNKCDKYSALYNIPAFPSYSRMLREIDAEVVNVCTPHYLHASMSIEAMESGKHVLVEKPMALSTADALLMIEASVKNHVNLFIVLQNRHNLPIALTRQVLVNGGLGEIYMVICNVIWNRTDRYYENSLWHGRKNLEGGALYTQVSHFLDILIWWFGELVESRAFVETKKHQIEIEDCGTAILRFKSSAIGSLSWTTCNHNENFEGSITILGERGSIRIGGRYLNKIDYWNVEAFSLPAHIAFDDKPNIYNGYEGTSSNHQAVISNVVNYLSGQPALVVTGQEGMHTIRAIEMIYQSVQQK